MRRAISSVVVSLMLIVIVGTTVGAKSQGAAAPVTFSAEGGTEDADGRLPISAFVHNAAPGTTFTAVAVVHGGAWEVTSEVFGPEVAVTTALMARSHDRDDHKQDKHKKDKHKKDKHKKDKHKKDKHKKHPKDPAQVPGVELSASTSVGIPGEANEGTVDIEVTITYGDTVVTVHTTGQVVG